MRGLVLALCIALVGCEIRIGHNGALNLRRTDLRERLMISCIEIFYVAFDAGERKDYQEFLPSIRDYCKRKTNLVISKLEDRTLR